MLKEAILWQRVAKKLVRARKALHLLWERCRLSGFVGRCYSKHKGHSSPILGSNIILFDGQELVVVYQDDGIGPVQTVTFVRSDPGSFGQEIRDIPAGVTDDQGSQ